MRIRMPSLTRLLDFLNLRPGTSELKGFRKALRKNPGDHGLRTRFAKFCLRHNFIGGDAMALHGKEAVQLYEEVMRSDIFDPEMHYLMGKYYQGDDDAKAVYVYREGIRRFNRAVAKDPEMKQEYVETTLAMALNLLTLQYSPMDPELDSFFKSVHKSYHLHVKRVELEGEIEKGSLDQERVEKLTREIEKIRAERGRLHPKIGSKS